MATDTEIEAAAAVIFAHHQFKGDDYIARLVAKYALEAAEKARTLRPADAPYSDRRRSPAIVGVRRATH